MFVENGDSGQLNLSESSLKSEPRLARSLSSVSDTDSALVLVDGNEPDDVTLADGSEGLCIFPET